MYLGAKGRYINTLPFLSFDCSLVNSDVFQQNSGPAHRAHDTVHLLQQETPEFIAPDL